MSSKDDSSSGKKNHQGRPTMPSRLSSKSQEKVGLGKLGNKNSPKVKSADKRASQGHADYELSDEDSLDHPQSSKLKLPNFRRSTAPLATGDEPLKWSNASDRKRMIEDDAIDTIRDRSGGDVFFDAASDDEHKSSNSDVPNEGTKDEKLESDISPQTKKIQFNPNDDVIIESGAYPDYHETNGEDEKEEGEDIYDHENGDTISTQSSENKFDNFKQFFRRKSTLRNRRDSDATSALGSISSGMKKLGGSDEEEERGFLSKFLEATGGGLVPALNSDEPQRGDLERGFDNEDGQDVPMVDMTTAAQQIVQAHSSLLGRTPATPDSGNREERRDEAPQAIVHGSLSGDGDGTELKNHIEDALHQNIDGETMTSSSAENAFYVPAVSHYDDIDDPDALEDLMVEGSYIAPVDRVRGGVLGSLLKLYQNDTDQYSKSQLSLTDSSLDQSTTASEKKSTKAKLNPFTSKKSKSQLHLTELNKSTSSTNLPHFKATRPKVKNFVKNNAKFKKKAAAEARITVHIADLLQRQRFILRLCKALMLYGAPTHRLEEYMIMTSRVLEIDGQFLYVPGCMIISFGDMITRTSEVQLVRCNQGLNLWKLHMVHSIYKQVVHDIISVEDANMEIDRILGGKNLYPRWLSVVLYAFCSSMVTPFAFGGGWVNVPVSFLIGLGVGLLQFFFSQKSNLYSNVFEVSASIAVSFCGRALGSIPNSNICFGAVVQGSLALILPGYIILCGSLELQSRNLVAGAVRMFYAIIYSLFLGFGITLGAALFGWIYSDASNETTCSQSVSPWFRFLFVPAFSIGLALINQARWSQLPVMTFISCCGYVVTYFSGLHFTNSTEFTSSMAAFVIGILGNLYSRIWKGLAVSAMLPAIFVQVPSGVASQSSLLAGVTSANLIVNNGTSTVVEDSSTSSVSFGITMIEVSIGISVGLFASALFVYPFGKKRTGLFTL